MTQLAAPALRYIAGEVFPRVTLSIIQDQSLALNLAASCTKDFFLGVVVLSSIPAQGKCFSPLQLPGWIYVALRGGQSIAPPQVGQIYQRVSKRSLDILW
ncbi:hypothetical protein HOLleu_06330 [Holothuria leucospilota]|uniref:Uncharacterized protein n=1 Tax=Holothuria leucospilota TaxID=206669 RepID=A0A9Q1CMP2_HOLLE|nr:hypothetical protein HOLleu_06330 [Holothuria leucospilota]